MKRFQFTCLKCGSQNIHFIIESKIDFSTRSWNNYKYDLQCCCLDCGNVEEYIPEPAVRKE